MTTDIDEIWTNDEIRSKCAEIYARNPDEGIDALRDALSQSDRAKISQALLEYFEEKEEKRDTKALLRKLGDLIDTARKEGYVFKR